MVNIVVSVRMGMVVATRAVATWMDEDEPARVQFVEDCLARHASGDWGVVSEEDVRANNAAALNGERLLSSYVVPDALVTEVDWTRVCNAPDCQRFPNRCDHIAIVRKLWVITEADRSVTTLLWPEDY